MKVIGLIENLSVRDREHTLPIVAGAYEFVELSKLDYWSEIRSFLSQIRVEDPDALVDGIIGDFEEYSRHRSYSVLSRVVNALRLVKPNRGIIRYSLPLSNLYLEDLVVSYDDPPKYVDKKLGSEIYRDDFNILSKILPVIESSYSESKESKKIPRLMTAFEFINRSRSQYPEYELVSLVVALECLFSTECQEIGYTLSNRCSWFLEPLLEDSDKRQNLFHDLKNMYSVRSKIVHGSSYKSEFLPRALGTARYAARASLLKILRNEVPNESYLLFFKSKVEEIEEYFAKLISGKISESYEGRAVSIIKD